MPTRPPKHRPNRPARPAENRPSAHARGYDAEWQATRLRVLRGKPLCEDCLAEGRTEAAEEVDHVVPLSKGGTHDRSNLRPLCKRHHSKKTVREDGGLGRAPNPR